MLSLADLEALLAEYDAEGDTSGACSCECRLLRIAIGYLKMIAEG